MGRAYGRLTTRNFPSEEIFRTFDYLYFSVGTINIYLILYVHVTVHRNKFLYNKTNRRTNFPVYFVKKHYMGGTAFQPGRP
jgi:hypothetical protein